MSLNYLRKPTSYSQYHFTTISEGRKLYKTTSKSIEPTKGLYKLIHMRKVANKIITSKHLYPNNNSVTDYLRINHPCLNVLTLFSTFPA